MFKSYRVVGWVAHETLVLAQGPLVLGLGLEGLGPGLDNISKSNILEETKNTVVSEI